MYLEEPFRIIWLSKSNYAIFLLDGIISNKKQKIEMDLFLRDAYKKDLKEYYYILYRKIMIQDTLTERLPIRELKYLLSIDYDTFKLYGKSIYKNESDRKNHFDQLKSFCSKSLKTNGVTEHNYYYSKNTPDNVGGRIFSKNGVQGLSKKIRGFIMKHTTDIDMKNAHPVILNYLCKLHNIHAPSLEYYITNINTYQYNTLSIYNK